MLCMVKENKNNSFFNLFVNFIMRNGKKQKASKFFLESLSFLKLKSSKNPEYIIKKAVENVRPLVFLKKKKIRGKTVFIPNILQKDTSKRIGIKWIIEYSRINSKGKKKFSEMLSDVIYLSSKKKGPLIKRREAHHLKVSEYKSFIRFW